MSASTSIWPPWQIEAIIFEEIKASLTIFTIRLFSLIFPGAYPPGIITAAISFILTSSGACVDFYTNTKFTLYSLFFSGPTTLTSKPASINL